MKKYLFLIPFFFIGILTAQKKKEDDSDKKEKAEKKAASLAEKHGDKGISTLSDGGASFIGETPAGRKPYE